MKMRTTIHIDKKYVSIWLTRLEAKDEKVRESLQPIIQDYGRQGYKVVILESGNQNLAELTKWLIANNLSNQ